MQNQPTNYPTAPVAPNGNNVEAYRLYKQAYATYVEACKAIFLGTRTTNEYANPLAHRCTICMHFFASRNMLFRHLKDTHFDKKPKESQTPCKRTGRKERIRKLESQIQMARLNSNSINNKPSGNSSAYVDKRPELNKTKPRTSVRKITTLPQNAVVDYDIPVHEEKPGKNTDLDFEFLDIPGFTTTDYVQLPNGTLAVECQPSETVTEQVLDNFGTASQPAWDYVSRNRERKVASKVSFKFSDELTNAGPKNFTPVQPGEYVKNAFQSVDYPQKPTRFYEASSLSAYAPTFTPKPSAFSEVNSEPGHERRESIFSRVGDDELFDSE